MNMEGEESQKDYDVLALAVYTSVSTGRDVMRQTGTFVPGQNHIPNRKQKKDILKQKKDLLKRKRTF